MLTGAADTAIYYDIMQRRVLLFSPEGRPVRTAALGGTDPMSMLSMPQPRGVDAAGRLYGQTMGMRMPAGGMPTPDQTLFGDSVVVVRHDLRTGHTDTITTITSMMAQSQPRMEMTGGAIRMTLTAPDFRANDSWAVMPDGRVALLRNGDYRVRFLSANGTGTLGPPVPHTLIPLTPEMQRATMDSIRKAIPTALGATNRAMSEAGARAGGALPAMPRIEMDVKEPERWASHLPPYNGILASPDGLLWVAVSDGNGAGHTDVLDGAGRLLARVRLASGESLAGLGRGTVYTTRKDEDDLRYLRRYTLPAPLTRR